MEPIEINAGACYLRALRADDRIDDRGALGAVCADPDRWIAERALVWTRGGCAWAIADPTSGALLGEVGVEVLADRATAFCWVAEASRGRGLASTALGAALRFASGALELGEIGFPHQANIDDNANDNTSDNVDPAAARLAAKCGFREVGTRGLIAVPDATSGF